MDPKDTVPLTQQPTQVPPLDTSNDKFLAGVAYILFFVPLLVGMKSEFVRFHTNQGTVLFLCSVIGLIIFDILPTTLHFGLFLAFVISPLYNLVLLVLIILGILNVVKGEIKQLPIIGGIKIIT